MGSSRRRDAESYVVEIDGGRLHGVIRTTGSSRSRARPLALLVHGTGFCASVWGVVSDLLVDDFDVLAIDRRGHGASWKPDDAYDFDDFADDIGHVLDACTGTSSGESSGDLSARPIFGIGHSAGGTDLLLAAARGRRFERLLAIEPTIGDPAAPPRSSSSPALSSAAAQMVDAASTRRSTFPSRDAAVARYTGRGIFAGWAPGLVEAYVRDGFEDLPDGSVTLACRTELERSMLRRIVAAMAGEDTGERGVNPFAALCDVVCPTTIVTTEYSQSVYGEMAERALRILPDATPAHLDGVGHAAAQVVPEKVVDLFTRAVT